MKREMEKETNDKDGMITVDRAALASLIGLVRIADAVCRDGENGKDVRIAIASAGGYANILQVAYGIDNEEISRHALRTVQVAAHGLVARAGEPGIEPGAEGKRE